jgi:predicted small lipoprotein YifL
MKSRLRTLLSVFLFSGFLAACGNKGDLVLPDPPPADADASARSPSGETQISR